MTRMALRTRPSWGASHRTDKKKKPRLAPGFPAEHHRGAVSGVVVQIELVRIRTQLERLDLGLALIRDVGVDHLLGEDVARGEPGLVVLHLVERLLEALAGRRDLRQ